MAKQENETIIEEKVTYTDTTAPVEAKKSALEKLSENDDADIILAPE